MQRRRLAICTYLLYIAHLDFGYVLASLSEVRRMARCGLHHPYCGPPLIEVGQVDCQSHRRRAAVCTCVRGPFARPRRPFSGHLPSTEGATLAVAFELLAPLVSDCARAPSLSGIGCAPMYIVKTNFGLSALAACRARGRIAGGIPHDDVVLRGLARC